MAATISVGPQQGVCDLKRATLLEEEGHPNIVGGGACPPPGPLDPLLCNQEGSIVADDGRLQNQPLKSYNVTR